MVGELRSVTPFLLVDNLELARKSPPSPEVLSRDFPAASRSMLENDSWFDIGSCSRGTMSFLEFNPVF